MGALSRERGSNRHGSSLFYHALTSCNRSAEEEAHERNFRDLVHVNIPAWLFIHSLFYAGHTHLTETNRFLLVTHMYFLPQAGNEREEIMLGRYPIDYYVEPVITEFSNDELMEGKHLVLGELYFFNKRIPPSPDDMYFAYLGHLLELMSKR